MRTKYYFKRPAEDFRNPKAGYSYSAKKMVELIETFKNSPHPYIQMVRMNSHGHEVVAEYMPSTKAWVNPIEALIAG